MNMQHLRALTRFWWLIAIGIGVALLAGVEMMAKVSGGLPPKVAYRAHPTYTATQLELVTTLDNPYLRTQQTTVVPRPARTQAVRGRGGGASTVTVPQAPNVQVSAPDVSVLVRAANYYPYLIQSDPVVAIRDKRFGVLPGQVTARALNSFQTPTRYRESTFPIIQVTGAAPGPKLAMRLTKATVVAFRQWLTQSQNRAKVPVGQRVLIQDLQVPEKAVASGGPKRGLGVLVAFVVLAAFVGLALVLDRMAPRRREGAAAALAPPAAVVEPESRQVEELARDLQRTPTVVADRPAAELAATRPAERSRAQG